MRITPQDVGRKFYANDLKRYVVRSFVGADVIIACDDVDVASDKRLRQIGYDLLLKVHDEYVDVGFGFREWADEPATDQVRLKDLRDEFAMVALQGLLSNSGGVIQSNAMNGWGFVNCELEDVATLSYGIADAMLKARGK